MAEPRAMQKRLSLLFLLGMFLVAGCGDSRDNINPPISSNNPTWAAPDPAALSSRLQAALDARMAQNRVPGALVGVFTPNGSWTSATGFSDVEARTPIAFSDNSSWRSITKSFTVTMVLQLVAEGRLDLDAPVTDYVDGVPRGEEITLRQLAEMRSGLYNYTTSPDFINALIADLQQPWTDEQLLGFAFSQPLNFEPGSEYEYSNTNTILLGVVAETVTGQTYEQLLQQRILNPLGLRNTALVTGTTLPQPFAKGYAYDPERSVYEEVVINNSALSSAGGMAGTFADLRAWGSALVSGSLLPAELHRQRFLSGPATNGPVYDSYGLGMGEIGRWWGHTGDALGYQAAVFTEPGTGSQIVILLNAANENHDVPVDITRDFQDILGWPL